MELVVGYCSIIMSESVGCVQMGTVACSGMFCCSSLLMRVDARSAGRLVVVVYWVGCFLHCS